MVSILNSNSELQELHKIKKRSIYYLLGVLLTVFFSIFIYSLLMKTDFSVLASVSYESILIIILLITITPFVLSIRLSSLARVSNIHTNADAALARGASDFLGASTPSASGALLVKAYWISRNGGGWEIGFSVGYADVCFDIFLVNAITIAISLWELSKNNVLILPILLFSLYSIIVPLLIFSVAIFSRTRKIIVKIANRFKIRIKEEHIIGFANILKNLKKNLKYLALSIISTIVSFVIQCFIVLIISSETGHSLSFFESAIFVALAQVMGGVPTPGGVIGIEYGLSIIAPPEMVVAWRLFAYSLRILYNFILFELFSIRYLK